MRTFAYPFCRGVASPLTLFSSPMFPVQRLFSPALLAATLVGPALAQTTPADSARSYQHQLGLTASPQFSNLFTTNRVLPIGLIYKRQVRPGHAWRVRLTGYYSRRDTATAGAAWYLPNASKGPDARVWEVNVFVGYEWQRRLGRHWQGHYGIEAGPGYRDEYKPYSNHYYNPVGFDGGGPFTATDTGLSSLQRWQLQSRGFAGLSYAVNNRVRIFAETAVVASYRHQKSWGSYTSSIDNPNYGISPGGIYRDFIVNTFHFEYRPIQVLGLSVCF